MIKINKIFQYNVENFSCQIVSNLVLIINDSLDLLDSTIRLLPSLPNLNLNVRQQNFVLSRLPARILYLGNKENVRKGNEFLLQSSNYLIYKFATL